MRPEEAVSDDGVISVDGLFDGLAARRVEALLTRAEAGRRLHVDLTQVREFHDFAIAVLANALTHCPAKVVLRGLRQHQIRLLRYFGVDSGPLAPLVPADAA